MVDHIEAVVPAKTWCVRSKQLHGDASVYSPAECCERSIDKYCFIARHFDWCLEHQVTSVDSDGSYGVRSIHQGLTEDGSEEIQIEIIEKRRCSHPDARQYECCDFVELGKTKVLLDLEIKILNKGLGYFEEEWQEKEMTEWISE